MAQMHGMKCIGSRTSMTTDAPNAVSNYPALDHVQYYSLLINHLLKFSSIIFKIITIIVLSFCV